MGGDLEPDISSVCLSCTPCMLSREHVLLFLLPIFGTSPRRCYRQYGARPAVRVPARAVAHAGARVTLAAPTHLPYRQHALRCVCSLSTRARVFKQLRSSSSRAVRSMSALRRDAPLLDAYLSYLEEPGLPFTIPGHKQRAAALDAGLGAVVDVDVPLYGGLDEIKLTRQTLSSAERLAARLWSADYARFSTGGSTHANQAIVLALGQPGDKVGVARTAHRSVLSALVLAGLQPVWMAPALVLVTNPCSFLRSCLLPIGLFASSGGSARVEEAGAALRARVHWQHGRRHRLECSDDGCVSALPIAGRRWHVWHFAGRPCKVSDCVQT